MSEGIKNMALLSGKLIVYDGACPLCISLRDKVLSWGIFPKEKVASYYDLQLDQQGQVDASRFQNEMALIDTAGGDTIYGPDALKRIFSERFMLMRLFFAIPGIMAPIRFIYKVLARNRYIVATPRKDMPACDCEPKGPLFYQLIYLIYSLVVALAVTFWFGAGLQTYFPQMSILQCGGAMLLIAGTGWIVQGLLTWAAFGEKRFQYLRHMFTVMRKGVMPLLPAAILMALMDDLHPIVPVLSVLLSATLMLRQHYLRVWQLGRSQAWTLIWFLSLQTTAVAWLMFVTHII